MATTTSPVSTGLFSNTLFIRALGWSNLAVMFAFLANTFATFWIGLPGSSFSGGAIGIMQMLLYPVSIIIAVMLVLRSSDRTLRQDSFRISDINVFFIRAAFWIVLLIGLVDSVISFLRIEEMLLPLVGEELEKNLIRPLFRGPYVHVPLMILGIIIAMFTKTKGFHWLALLIVVAELLIVIFRFIFSYEQAFMADLVRFWYGAFFLFASAFTLLEEGHVRVDIFYAGMAEKSKGWINAIGSIFLGMTLCWTILILGMAQKTSIINSPILRFETTQSGYGLYVKYLMAGFLGVFAISMMIQFVSYLMGAVADYRGEEGKYEPNGSGAH
ncbi:permease [Amylibacter kogurei]|uniref:TRAP transporter small permease protein n=1 Tax=Paramylibacter kogurei TaxID=1889778 RepID=A0A2G5K485_9RHOB|nr:TRAP transporter small permease subunit [Amylibacter kogurei]PIB23534.1 permease [Amylibacter kogurei]